MIQSTKTIVAFHHFHPLAEVDLPPLLSTIFIKKMDLILDRKAFISTLIGFPCLSSSDPSNMVYQLLQDCFVPNDFANGFANMCNMISTRVKPINITSSRFFCT